MRMHRADRSPGEFYQLDMEMAFASQEDVFAVLEDVLPPVFEKYGIYKDRFQALRSAESPYHGRNGEVRYRQAGSSHRPGSAGCNRRAWQTADSDRSRDRRVKAVVVGRLQGVPEKSSTRSVPMSKYRADNKAYWFKLDENGELVGGISKFLQERKDAVMEALGLKDRRFRQV